MTHVSRSIRTGAAAAPRRSRAGALARAAAPLGFIFALAASDCGGPDGELVGLGPCQASPRITEPGANQIVTPEHRQLRGELFVDENCTVQSVVHRVNDGAERSASASVGGHGFIGQIDLEGLAEGIHRAVVTVRGENPDGPTTTSDSVEFYYRPGLEGDFYLVTMRPDEVEVELASAAEHSLSSRVDVWRTLNFRENVDFEEPEGVPAGVEVALFPFGVSSPEDGDLRTGARLDLEFSADGVTPGVYEVGVITESHGSLIRRGDQLVLRLLGEGGGACDDFDLRLDFNPIEVAAGTSDVVAVFVDRSPGFSESVELMVTAGPDGTQPHEVLSEAVFGPNPVESDANSTVLSFHPRADLTVGASYDLTISGGSPHLEADPDWCVIPVTFKVVE